jgi:hypothetical protein
VQAKTIEKVCGIFNYFHKFHKEPIKRPRCNLCRPQTRNTTHTQPPKQPPLQTSQHITASTAAQTQPNARLTIIMHVPLLLLGWLVGHAASNSLASGPYQCAYLPGVAFIGETQLQRPPLGQWSVRADSPAGCEKLCALDVSKHTSTKHPALITALLQQSKTAILFNTIHNRYLCPSTGPLHLRLHLPRQQMLAAEGTRNWPAAADPSKRQRRERYLLGPS